MGWGSHGCASKVERVITPRLATVSLAATLLLAGCKSTAPATTETSSTNTSPAPASTAAPAIDPATTGSVTGEIHFTGKAPERIRIDMSADPACALSDTPNLTEQYVVSGGHLANVFVYIKSGLPSWSAPADAPSVVLDQKGCRYVPHVIGVQQGGKVEFRNSDPATHNVHTLPQDPANHSVDISEMPMGQPQSETFRAPELMIPVRCNNHPWMQAFINVAPNPFFAVTGPDGTFTLHGLPPGTYTVAAVHEKLGEQDTQVTIPAKGTSKVEFTFAAR
jgi:plastocyanin